MLITIVIMSRSSEIEHIRSLARRVKRIAQNPLHTENRRKWIDHNALRTREPLILVFPEGCWSELLPEGHIVCRHPSLRQLEKELLRRIYYADYLKDDNPISGEIVVTKKILPLDWGLNPQRIFTEAAKGAYEVKPVLNEAKDVDKLRIPDIVYDEEKTLKEWSLLGEAIGDILPVRLKGVQHQSFHFTAMYMDWRGHENFYTDFYLEPELIKDVMSFLLEAFNSILESQLRQGLLSYNSDGTYHSSGGNGYLDTELNGGSDIQGPFREYGSTISKSEQDEIVELSKMWASAESQEMAAVGPEHHRDFVLPYESALLKRFGLSGYGCCEDLTQKIENCSEFIPNLRRISVSPWADVDQCAEKLGDRYIYSWKPNPAHIVGGFDETFIRSYIRHTLEKTREENNILEIVLKDTHTCDNDPRRFERWVRIAREEIAKINGLES